VNELMKVEEFAAALSVEPCTIRKWLSQRRLQPVRIGRCVRLRKTDLERIVANGLDPKRRMN
jgi:excisionase family DNA binding protein